MLLTIDLGNTSLKLAIFHEDKNYLVAYMSLNKTIMEL